MPYDANSTNNFVQKQGGSLANLGASPTYTGAPVSRGTPPGPQGAGPQMPMPYQAGQRPMQRQMPYQACQMPQQATLQNLGQRMTPQQMAQRRQMMQRQGMRQPQGMRQGQVDPRMMQRPQMDPRMMQGQQPPQQRMPQQMPQGSLSRLGQNPQMPYRR